jgi:hypothetical protein
MIVNATRAVTESVVEVVFGVLRTDNHELKAAALELLVALTSACSEDRAGKLLGGCGCGCVACIALVQVCYCIACHRHEKLLLRCMGSVDGREEVYR